MNRLSLKSRLSITPTPSPEELEVLVSVLQERESAALAVERAQPTAWQQQALLEQVGPAPQSELR